MTWVLTSLQPLRERAQSNSRRHDRSRVRDADASLGRARIFLGRRVETYPADQLPPAANVGLLEDLLEMLLDRVRGNDEALGDLGG